MTKHYTPAQIDAILKRHKRKVLDTYEPEPLWPYLVAGLSLFFGVVVMVTG